MMTPQPMSPQQAPPPGGPQMPPPQPSGPPQQGGMQGTDPMAMLAQLKSAPDAQLQQMVQAKHPLGSFALVMLNGRNQQRKAAQAQQMQQVAQQPPVAQRVMQESQGIAALPTGQAIPQQYAEGGIVRGFYKGGSTTPTAEEEYARLIRAVDPYEAMYGVPVDAPSASPVDSVGRMYSGEIDRIQAQRYRDAGRASEAGAVEAAVESRPPVSPTFRVEGANQPVRGASPVGPQARPDVQFTRPGIAEGPLPGSRSASARTGIAGVLPGKGGFPAFSAPDKGAPPAHMTDAEWTEFARRKTEELTAMYGPSYAAKYLAEMQAERDKIKTREPRAREEAWLTAGLRMMQGKSRHGLQNIGAGGEAGIAQYRADRTQADEQMRAIRREMMGLEASDQQRKDTMVTAGIGQADKRNEQMSKNRAEYKADRVFELNFGVKRAEYEQMDRKISIMAQQAAAEGERNGLAKTDVVARIYQTAQQEALKTVEESAQKDFSSPYRTMSPAQRAEAAQTIAEAWIKNNAGIKAIMGQGSAPRRVQAPAGMR